MGISDGDTLTARCGCIGAYERVKVRIAAIDAPEKAQPYGQRSKQALSNICFREQALITEIDTDRYGRTVADVRCNGEDAGSRMVSEGWAWVYDYNHLATKRGGGLFKLQDSARARHAGLWADFEAHAALGLAQAPARRAAALGRLLLSSCYRPVSCGIHEAATLCPAP